MRNRNNPISLFFYPGVGPQPTKLLPVLLCIVALAGSILIFINLIIPVFPYIQHNSGKVTKIIILQKPPKKVIDIDKYRSC